MKCEANVGRYCAFPFQAPVKSDVLVHCWLPAASAESVCLRCSRVSESEWIRMIAAVSFVFACGPIGFGVVIASHLGRFGYG